MWRRPSCDDAGESVELTYDDPKAVLDEVVRDKRENAHRDLARWLGGDHTSNNTYR
jgi:hypothetical protein